MSDNQPYTINLCNKYTNAEVAYNYKILSLYSINNKKIDNDLLPTSLKKFNEDSNDFECHLSNQIEKNLYNNRKSGAIYINIRQLKDTYEINSAKKFANLAINEMLSHTTKYQNLYIVVSSLIYIGNEKNKLIKNEKYIRINVDRYPNSEN